MSVYACPVCLSSDHLFENVELVSAWRDVKSIRVVDGEIKVELGREREAEWHDAQHLSYGCANPETHCDTEAVLHEEDLVLLDRDGQPVPKPLPGQEAMPL